MKTIRFFFQRTLALALSLALLGAGSLTALAAESTTVTVTGRYCQTEARTMLEGINSFRTGSEAWYLNEDNTTKTECSGLQPLVYDYTLEKIAMLRAAEIATQGFNMSHTRPDGTSCFTAFQGTAYTAGGENLGMGENCLLDSPSMLEAWKETNKKYGEQGHRRNMLSSDFTCVGIAHFRYNGEEYWVQEFGAPALDTTPTAANDSETTVTVRLASGSGSPDTGSGSPDAASHSDSSTATAKAPSKTSITKLSSKKGKVTVKWKRNKKAAGYELQYAADKRFTSGTKLVRIQKNKTVSKTFKPAKGTRTCYVRVRCCSTSGGQTACSAWSKARKIKVKK